jgi:hypothetical protein
MTAPGEEAQHNPSRKWDMKTAMLIAAAIVAAAVLPAAYGQSATTKLALPTGVVGMPDGGGWGTYEELFKVCEPDKDQLKKFADIEARRKADTQDKQKALQKAQQAFTKEWWAPKDAAAAKAATEAQAQYTDLFNALNQINGKALADTLAVLTVEQKAKWQEYVALKAVKARYANVTFTDPQWDKIIEACEKLLKDSSLRRGRLIGELYAKVNAILTPEQKAKRLLATGRYAEMDKVCHFTPEQIDKLVAIEGDRYKAVADLQARLYPQKMLVFQAEREAMAAGGNEALSAVQPMWQEMNKHYSELDTQFEDKVQTVMTDQQKAAWAGASTPKK